MDIKACLLPQFQPYVDQFGMITNNNQGLSVDNGNLFTAHYVYGLVANDLMTDLEKQRILQVYRNNFMQPGLLSRKPGLVKNRQAQDDMYGLMGVEAMLSPLDRVMTKAMYEYGKISAKGIDLTEPDPQTEAKYYKWIKWATLGRCRWVWNNISPGTFDDASWLGRFPAFLAVMQMAAGDTVNPFNWLWWMATSLRSAWFGTEADNNGDCLMLHGAIAARDYGFLTNFVCDQIHKGIKHKYGSAGGLMLDYFNDPKHPLVALLKDVY